MTPTCQNCHNPNPGAYYDLFTGTPATDSDAYPDRRAASLGNSIFANFRREKVFICDQCASKAKRNQRGLLVLAVLLLLGFGGAGVLSLVNWIEGESMGFYGTVGTIILLLLIPVILVWIFSLVRDLLRKGISTKNGESVALLARMTSVKDGRFAWVPGEFKMAFKTSSPAGSGVPEDSYPVITLDQ